MNKTSNLIVASVLISSASAVASPDLGTQILWRPAAASEAVSLIVADGVGKYNESLSGFEINQELLIARLGDSALATLERVGGQGSVVQQTNIDSMTLSTQEGHPESGL